MSQKSFDNSATEAETSIVTSDPQELPEETPAAADDINNASAKMPTDNVLDESSDSEEAAKSNLLLWIIGGVICMLVLIAIIAFAVIYFLVGSSKSINKSLGSSTNFSPHF